MATQTEHKLPSPVPTILKGWAIGVTIGATVGTGLGMVLGKAYGASATIGAEGLITIFIIVGVIAGSYYGCMTAYSNYRKQHHLGI